MAEKKSEHPPAPFEHEPFDESREHLVQELRIRAEQLYERASLDQIVEVTCLLRSLLAKKGLLPEHASKQIH